jgi:teichuronic acid biosynthesis glycosyltransferase TuaC
LHQAVIKFARDSTRVRLIPNGIDHGRLRATVRGVRPLGTGRIVAVGNLWPVKGIDVALEALARLSREGLRWTSFTVVGDGPARVQLEAMARRLGIEDKVRFAGRLPHDATLRTIAGSDIFCLPSWQESFGVVYLEAMACSLPVIGCRGQGAAEIVRNGVDGILVEPRDADGLARALKGLLDDPDRARRMGESGTKRAAIFSWSDIAEQYADCYTAAIAGYRGIRSVATAGGSRE